MKYLKYYISTFTLLVAIQICFLGEYYPSIFFVGFSLFIIIGDLIIKEDSNEKKYWYESLLNLPMYLNLPLLVFIVIISVFVLSDEPSGYFVNGIMRYLHIDIEKARTSLNIFDSISLVALMGLFIGIMGTVPGHELVHRKKNKFDMFIGNWLLALSWDCAFAVEHVYGHHKNVCLPSDPATAKRGENIYVFIIKAAIKEQIDAWRIESSVAKRRGKSFWSINNKMLIGYMRSITITAFSFLIGGIKGMMIYLLIAFIAKALLEVINYSEHYGLVRVEGEPVLPHHSWNSNSIFSSIYLYNVTRHSSHHEKANLRYWELRSYKDAPMMPQGYLTMLYMALFLPFFFHSMMAKKLLEWDEKFASDSERMLAKEQNQNSGIPILLEST
ncbi:MAG: alkane 1-monooxygenase [Candidatus Neomarinimicrobiota bacterium]